MSSTDVGTDTSTEIPQMGSIDMKLEVVTLPVSDVDRARRFYQSLGWRMDADLVFGGDVRVVQLTPPHSSCSIAFGNGLTTAEPGSAQRFELAAPHWGRPSVDDLRHDLRAVTREIRPDWDLSTPGLRDAWGAGDLSRFHGWNERAPASPSAA